MSIGADAHPHSEPSDWKYCKFQIINVKVKHVSTALMSFKMTNASYSLGELSTIFLHCPEFQVHLMITVSLWYGSTCKYLILLEKYVCC